jgi:hypothetical protein
MPKAPTSSRIRVKPSQHAFHGLAQRIQALNRQAVREYTPVVEQILGSGCREVRPIEHTLDGLLDFCGNTRVLALYKRLCRHYWLIDPVASASYIRAYREMWDTPPVRIRRRTRTST